MTVENFTYITSLDPAHPDGTEPKSEGDNHIAGIKTAVKNSFPAISGAVTATHTELNVLDGITATVAELNILDGVTATAAELNALDGITSTVTELNYTDGVTSAIQTQIDAKAPSLSPTFTGTPAGPTATAGTATTQIATTAFVTSAIADAGISGGLPVQTGNARKVLSTDGSAYSLVVGDGGLHDAHRQHV